MRRVLERIVRLLSQDEPKPVSAGTTMPPEVNPASGPPSGPPALPSGEGVGATAASGAAGRRDLVIEALRLQVAERSGGRLRAEQVKSDAPLFDRGYLDSFSYVEFLAFIERSYHVRIADSELAGHLITIADMADHILKQEPSRQVM
jgi:acyl carrier protein